VIDRCAPKISAPSGAWIARIARSMRAMKCLGAPPPRKVSLYRFRFLLRWRLRDTGMVALAFVFRSLCMVDRCAASVRANPPMLSGSIYRLTEKGVGLVSVFAQLGAWDAGIAVCLCDGRNEHQATASGGSARRKKTRKFSSHWPTSATRPPAG
jgi:hypothetical protein